MIHAPHEIMQCLPPLRSRLLASLLLAPLLATAWGCETGPSDSTTKPAFVSGSRLRAVVEDGGDGAELFVRWHDTKLDVDCRFGHVAGDKLTCLPVEGAEVHYTDASCTKPVAVLGDCPLQTKYAFDWTIVSSESCVDTVAMTTYTLGASLGVGTHYRKDSGGSCVKGEEPVEQFEAIPADPVDWVEATPSFEPNGDDAAPELLVASDGTRQVTGALWDPARNAACEPVFLTGDPVEVRCAPRGYGWAQAGVFSDAACTKPVGGVPDQGSCFGDPDVFAMTSDLPFPQPQFSDLYERGPAVAEDGLFTESGGECHAMTGGSGYHYYELGAKIERSAFPELVYRKSGGGRLKLNVLTANGAPARLPDELFDSKREEGCLPETMSDGSRRCVGMTAADSVNGQEFEDASCTKRIVHVPDDDAVRTLVKTFGEQACDTPIVSLALLGGPYSGEKLYQSIDGTCYDLQSPYPQGFYEVGDPVPFDALAPVTHKTQ